MSRKIFLAAVVGIAISFQHANAGDCCSNGCDQCLSCPQCEANCCELKVEKDEVDKHCWKVECKEICIPNVVFPWQKSCCDPSANNGACVIKVKVLKKHKYTCPSCKYTWSPKPCCNNGCGSGCGSGCAGGCDAGCACGCDAGSSSGEVIFQNEMILEGGEIQPQPATPQPATPQPATPQLQSPQDVPPAPPAPSAKVKSKPKHKFASFKLTQALKKLRHKK